MTTLTSYETTSEAFEDIFGFPVEEASDSDYDRAEDKLNDAVVHCLEINDERRQALINAGFGDVAERIQALDNANMAMDCAKENL